ncbi:MAG: phosphoribosyltransferase family protein [Gammaproteobacteria bacterium]
MVYNWLDGLRQRWLPGHCILCQAADPSGLHLCHDCRADLPWLAPGCPRCALPTPVPGQPCGACQARPPAFDSSTALFRYAAPLDTLVQQLKFGQGLHLARLFAALLGEHLAERPADAPRPDAILPVPLHPQRQRVRGFNQALEIARPLARRLGCRLEATACVRERATPSQTRLHAAQRRRNLRGAFRLTGPLPGRHIAILDDVMTTGSTLDALARQLRQAGAEHIEVWVVARATCNAGLVGADQAAPTAR